MDRKHIKVWAHRGLGSGGIPENSMTAFRRGKSLWLSGKPRLMVSKPSPKEQTALKATYVKLSSSLDRVSPQRLGSLDERRLCHLVARPFPRTHDQWQRLGQGQEFGRSQGDSVAQEEESRAYSCLSLRRLYLLAMSCFAQTFESLIDLLLEPDNQHLEFNIDCKPSKSFPSISPLLLTRAQPMTQSSSLPRCIKSSRRNPTGKLLWLHDW
jgi:hypothetical protein